MSIQHIGIGLLLASSLLGEMESKKTITPCFLPAVFRLANSIENERALVLFGAPASGKTEQMTLAINEPRLVFDLRKSFLEYAEQEKISVDQKKAYQTVEAKKRQREWFNREKSNILQNLVMRHENIIVFDEFDLTLTNEFNEDELKTALDIIKLAHDLLHETSKKVVFIIHTAGLTSSDLWNAFQDQLHLNKQDIIKIEYFDRDTEKCLLNQTELTPDEKIQYMAWAQGNPSAYLVILSQWIEKKKELFSIQQLQKTAREIIIKVCEVIKRTENQEVIGLLNNIAHNHIHVNEIDKQKILELSYTGLIGIKDNKPFMPPLVQEIIKTKAVFEHQKSSS